MIRTLAFVLASAATFASTTPLSAQDIDYQSGAYEYARTADPAQDDDVVTETITPTPLPASRSIETRRTGAVPVFVASPVVQAHQGQPVLVTQAPGIITAPVQHTTATPVLYRGAMPVFYVDPTRPTPQQASAVVQAPRMGAARSIPRRGSASAPAPLANTYFAPPTVYGSAAAPLASGTQFVTFDRQAWLGSCRDRLAGYAEADRDAALAALGLAAVGYSPDKDRCEAYLDSYLNSAVAGTLTVTPAYGQSYMLVPVTVATDK